jgi:hypothetical protein
MLASVPASMVNQKQTDLGIPNRFRLKPSRFSLGVVVQKLDNDDMLAIAAYAASLQP